MATKTKDAVMAELAELGSSLADDAVDEAQKRETLNKILDSIGTLDKATAKDLFKNEKVQRLIELASDELASSSAGQPGSYIPGPYAQKVQWTEADLQHLIDEGKMEIIHNYRPVTTPRGPIGWNGLQRHFRARQPITCPACFVYVYEQHLDAEQLAEQHAAWLMQTSDHVDDRSILTEEGFRARSTGTKGRGHYVPGGGNVAMGDREE